MPKWEPACRLRALRHSVSHVWATQAKKRKKCCHGRGRTWANIAVRPCIHSFITHHKHHPFENKMWEIYFYKEVFSFVCWSRHYSWLCSRVFLYTRNIVYNSCFTAIVWKSNLFDKKNVHFSLYIYIYIYICVCVCVCVCVYVCYSLSLYIYIYITSKSDSW